MRNQPSQQEKHQSGMETVPVFSQAEQIPLIQPPIIYHHHLIILKRKDIILDTIVINLISITTLIFIKKHQDPLNMPSTNHKSEEKNNIVLDQKLIILNNVLYNIIFRFFTKQPLNYQKSIITRTREI
jgi:hypothetical protein